MELGIYNDIFNNIYIRVVDPNELSVCAHIINYNKLSANYMVQFILHAVTY